MLPFADDITLIANTERALEQALNVTETVFNNYTEKKDLFKFEKLFFNFISSIRSKNAF